MSSALSCLGSASGKAILLGEHAVVYGSPALVAGLDQGAKAEARRLPPGEVSRLSLAGVVPAADHEVHRAFAKLRASLGAPELDLELSLELPAGSGVGASAALGAAAARAVAGLGFWDPGEALPVAGGPLGELGALGDARERAIERAALAWETVFHGNPSGIDTAAALRPGVLRFVKGSPPLKLPVERELELVLAVAGPPASTKLMVERVAQRRAAQLQAFEAERRELEAWVRGAELALASGQLEELGRLMNLNHELLVHWETSTQELDQACTWAREAGALGAKLTGSGGGGCILALTRDCQPVMGALQQRGLACLSCRVRATEKSL